MIRLAIHQPALPKYRVPLFAAISDLEDIQLSVLHGSEEPTLKNVPAKGFFAKLVSKIEINTPVIGSLYWYSSHLSIVNKSKFDVVVFNGNTRFLSLIPALIIAKITKVPTIVWGHWYSKSPSAWRDFIRTIPARLANAIILYDAVTAEKIISSGLDKKKVFVAKNGLDSHAISIARSLWQKNEDKLEEFKKDKKLHQSRILIFVGRLDLNNRLDVVIEALSEPKLVENLTKLIVIGSGEPERARLTMLAEKNGVSDSIIWVGDVYDEYELAPWMLISDALVYPSNSGLSIIHGFNYGLPAIICSPICMHNPEVFSIKHGHNGVIANSLDPRDLSSAIIGLLFDNNNFEKIGKKARLTADIEYNVQSMCSVFEKAIRQVAGRS